MKKHLLICSHVITLILIQNSIKNILNDHNPSPVRIGIIVSKLPVGNYNRGKKEALNCPYAPWPIRLGMGYEDSQ